MVYTQTCSWVEDFLAGNEPDQLIDTWDYIQWIQESEVCELFKDIVLPTFKTKRARDDATHILMTILWEYFLFRRDSIRVGELDGHVVGAVAEELRPYNFVFADEFWKLFDVEGGARLSLIRQKVFMNTDSEAPSVKKECSEFIARSLYESSVAFSSLALIGCKSSGKLASSSGWMVKQGKRKGRLVVFRVPVQKNILKDSIPSDAYMQGQIQMQCYDVEATDFVECKLRFSNSLRDGVHSGPNVIGAAIFYDNQYELSPLFENNEEGQRSVAEWKGSHPGMKKVWQIESWQVQTSKRNPRWWSVVGRDTLTSFWSDVDIGRQDPLYYAPAVTDFDIITSPLPDEPLFLDD